MTRGARSGSPTKQRAGAGGPVKPGALLPPALSPPPVIVPLTRGLVTLIDASDADAVLQYSWCAAPRNHTHYGQARIGQVGVYLHRFIMQPPLAFVVDHVDGDGLNNRRNNLRVCTVGQNCYNLRTQRGGTSRFRGVYWSRGAWRAQIRDGRQIYLGTFTTEREAAEAHDAAARERFGEYATSNFP